MSLDEAPLSAKAFDLRRAFDNSFAEARIQSRIQHEDLLSVRLNGDSYAIRLKEIQGFFKDKKIAALPGPVRELLGVAGFRGLLVPVYDLEALMGYAPQKNPRWLVMAAGLPVALAFPVFEGYLRVEQDVFAPYGAAAASNHVQEVVHTGQDTRPVIHLSSVLAVIKTTVAHHGRLKES